MKANENLPIYQNGLTLSPSEEKLLTNSAWSQSKIIAKILKNRPGQGCTFMEMKQTLQQIFQDQNINQDSVKRAMSTMTATKGAPAKYQDKEGRWPLVKTGEKRVNPETGIGITVYAWNHRYGQPLTHREIVEKYKGQQQMDFHLDRRASNV
ncbi:MAG: hypothetical protein LAT56_14695 [Wenzhouxiangella sp.]|nr:hypothetical protein [Wenzhouxiangella sp.]